MYGLHFFAGSKGIIKRKHLWYFNMPALSYSIIYCTLLFVFEGTSPFRLSLNWVKSASYDYIIYVPMQYKKIFVDKPLALKMSASNNTIDLVQVMKKE